MLLDNTEEERIAMSIRFDYSYTGIKKEEFENRLGQLALANTDLMQKTGRGNDFLGWVDHSETYDKKEYDRIKEAAEKIK